MTGIGMTGAGTSVTWRLAVGRGREAVVRQLLVVLGTAVASTLLLEAVGVARLARRGLYLSASAGSVDETTGQVTLNPGSAGAIRIDYLVQPDLRHGVVFGFVLCVVPLLVFVAIASRVAVRQRDERLATLRLAGATTAQVRLLAALDTSAATTAGVLLGAVAFVVARAAVLASSYGPGQVHAVAEGVVPGVLPGALVLLLLVVTVALVAALSMRSVLVTPLGVARKAPRRAPRPWGLLLLGGGLLVLLLLRLGQPGVGTRDLLLALALVTTMTGLVTCGPWLTSLTGAALVRWGRGPASLLAGRRLQDDPRSQARAMSALVLVALAAAVALDAYASTFSGHRPGDGFDEGFYRQGYQAAAVGMVFSALVAGAGLLLTTAEGLLERRRTLSRLAATGTDRSTLRRAVLLQVAAPTLPATLLATSTAVLVLSSTVSDSTVDVAALVLIPLAAVVVSLLAGAASLPFLRRATDLEQLRVP